MAEINQSDTTLPASRPTAVRPWLKALALFIAAFGMWRIYGPGFFSSANSSVPPDTRLTELDLTPLTPSSPPVALGDLKGKVVLVNFWGTWCPPCVEEVPSLNRFARETASSGVVVLGVSIDKNPQLYKQFRDRFHLDFQTFRDPDENISASYGTFKIPETYIIDRNAKVVRKIISNTDWTDPEMVRFVTSL